MEMQQVEAEFAFFAMLERALAKVVLTFCCMSLKAEEITIGFVFCIGSRA
jgi:hypothetical protein